MPDHYRTLIQSLMQLGFLFSRLGERKQEVWRNRQTDQEVMFDRREASASKDVVEAVVKRAKAAKPGVKASGAAVVVRPVEAASPRASVARAKAKATAASSKAKAAGRGKTKAAATKRGSRPGAR
jgi:hypothetical protein